MRRIKVIGIGSPFGDDQLGFKVIEKLKQDNSLNHYIPTYLILESHDRPGIRLLELMADCEIAFLIDAVFSGQSVGTLYRLKHD